MEDFTTNRDAFGYDDEPTPPDRWLAWLTVAAFVWWPTILLLVGITVAYGLHLLYT